jgi:hypothetical protein
MNPKAEQEDSFTWETTQTPTQNLQTAVQN